jgi:beta-lactamase regulating signal transducer with metallopeptidase domain
METYFSYIIKATCCLSFFYIASLLLFRNHNGFIIQRVYLAVSVTFALILPQNHFSINPNNINIFTVTQIQPVNIIRAEPKTTIQSGNQVIPVSNSITTGEPSHHSKSLTNIIVIIYWSILIILTIRLIYSILYIYVCFLRSNRKKIGRYTINYSTSINGSFSFLRWIFINAEDLNKNDNQNIINHELVHAAQYHSIDTIVIELLSAVMWFNPLIWLMRKWMQQLHEYLADEGVVKSGINILEYQALLVNQVAGDRLICLPSGFNQSLIKKRLAMMTKTRIKQKTGYRLIAMLPLAGLMFLSLSFTNKKESVIKPMAKTTVLSIHYPMERANPSIEVTKKVNPMQRQQPVVKADSAKKPVSSNIVTAVSLDRMNVFYLGVDNPVTVAASDISSKNVTVSIDNGKISGSNGSYIVQPSKVGKAIINVYDGTKQIGSWAFRVKFLPDPVVKVDGKKSGTISVSKLLTIEEVVADLENFDFDARFEVIEFSVYAKINGFFRDEVSKSAKITDAQRALMGQLKPGDKVTFTDIKAKAPDGSIRQLNAIMLTIQE